MLQGTISITLPRESVRWIDEKVKAHAYTGYSYVVDLHSLERCKRNE